MHNVLTPPLPSRLITASVIINNYYASAVSLFDSGEERYIKAINSNNSNNNYKGKRCVGNVNVPLE